MIIILTVLLLGLCWGSFLNVVGFRFLQGTSPIGGRSKCPSCSKTIAWYDLIPLLSWIALRGKCRRCSASISYLYPLIEGVTALVFLALAYSLFPEAFAVPGVVPMADSHRLLTFVVHALYFSALIVALRTDLEAMVIFTATTLWLIPVMLAFSVLGHTAATLPMGIVGALVGYALPWVIGIFFFKASGKKGIGEGDFELLAFIGSFQGPLAVWFTLTIAALVGLVVGAIFLYITGKGKEARIPFGPFLVVGAIVSFFFHSELSSLLLGIN